MSTQKLSETVQNRGWITLWIMLATIMQVLDTTIANVALPSMTGDLGASIDSITWVLTSYIVAAAIMTPVTGWLADRYGRKELFITALLGFTLSSLACGLAWNLNSMVGFRIFQGIFGAAIIPLSQTFLLDINPKERHGQAMAMWGAGIMVAPIIGPTLGGWLTENFNWRWVFIINLPIGIVAILGCIKSLPSIERRLRSFDIFGFTMLSIGIGSLQLLLDRGSAVDWFDSHEIWIESGLVIIGLWVFVVHIMTTPKDAFLDPQIFRDKNVATGLTFIFVVGIILLASLALLPPMLANIFHYPTMTTGLVLAPRGVGTLFSMILVGKVVKKVDERILILLGLLLTAWSLEMMTNFTPQMDSDLIIISGVVQGLGLGLVFVPLSTITFITLDRRFLTDATALFSLSRNIGSSIGISIVSAIFTRNMQVNHNELSIFINPFEANLKPLVEVYPNQQGMVLSVIDGLVNQQAAMISYVNDFKFMMIVTLCTILFLPLMQKPKPRELA